MRACAHTFTGIVAVVSPDRAEQAIAPSLDCGLRSFTHEISIHRDTYKCSKLRYAFVFSCSPWQYSLWTHAWAKFGSPVDAQSHQDMRKEYKHHTSLKSSYLGQRTSRAEALVFSSTGILMGFC